MSHIIILGIGGLKLANHQSLRQNIYVDNQQINSIQQTEENTTAKKEGQKKTKTKQTTNIHQSKIPNAKNVTKNVWPCKTLFIPVFCFEKFQISRNNNNIKNNNKYQIPNTNTLPVLDTFLKTKKPN